MGGEDAGGASPHSEGGHITPAEFLLAEVSGRGGGKERGAECWPSCC